MHEFLFAQELCLCLNMCTLVKAFECVFVSELFVSACVLSLFVCLFVCVFTLGCACVGVLVFCLCDPCSCVFLCVCVCQCVHTCMHGCLCVFL